MQRRHIAIRARLLYLFAAVSVTLWLGTITLWIQSYWRTRSVRLSRAQFECLVVVDRGVLGFDLCGGDTGDRGFDWNDYRRAAVYGRDKLNTFGQTPWSRLGFGTWTYDRDVGSGFFLGRSIPGRAVFLPLWCVAAATAVTPLLWVHRRHRRKLREVTNLCVSCGYDVRATPARCPECGTVASRGHTAA